MARRTPKLFAFLALTALLPACGGSGGSGGAGGGGLTNAALTGTYFMFQFSATDDVVTEGLTNTGTFSADGMGVGGRTYFVNDMGVVSGPISQSFTYDVESDGALALSVGPFLSSRGGVTTDGNVALLGLPAPNFNPGVMALFRRGGLYSAASLTGLYRMVIFTVSPANGATETYTGPVTFNGTNSCSFTGILRNSMGTLTTSTATFPYTVAGDGASTVTIGGEPYSGGVVAGGALAIWSGALTASGNPALVVVVRSATSSNLATFQGDYWIVRLIRGISLGGYTSHVGTLTADGVGGFSYDMTANAEGNGSAGTGSNEYLVEADGEIRVKLGSISPGGITQDGRFAVLGGASGPPANPTICLLVRK